CGLYPTAHTGGIVRTSPLGEITSRGYALAVRSVARRVPMAGLRSAEIPADAVQVPAGDEPFFFGAERRCGKRPDPVPDYASRAELPGDEDVDALAGYTCVPGPSVALAAARAAAARQ